jgi:hypothetical protein
MRKLSILHQGDYSSFEEDLSQGTSLPSDPGFDHIVQELCPGIETEEELHWNFGSALGLLKDWLDESKLEIADVETRVRLTANTERAVE